MPALPRLSPITGASRRSVLRSFAIGGLAVGGASALSSCGGGSGSGGGDGTLRVGSNEASGSGPAYERNHAAIQAFAEASGITVEENAVDHNTFQEQVNSYLQGNPDDVFTWFAGFRMDQFAQQGLIADISDVWPIEGIGDQFKKASTGSDGKQYLVPTGYYPWAMFYNAKIWGEKGWEAPSTYDEMITLFGAMKADGLSPLAFSDKDGWPAMGTFDILNMRLNGYDYHMSLMKGEEDWTGPKVKSVFDSFSQLLEFSQPDPLGRTWQEAATAMAGGEAGTMLLGTFVVDAVGEEAANIDMFTFPEMDSAIGADAIDAPIDGWAMSSAAKNTEGAKEFLTFIGSAAAADAANNSASAPMIAVNDQASTEKYTDLQKKSVELVSSAKSIAQFMDRDTRADFASTVMIPSIQEFIKNPADLDSILKSIQDQKVSIFGS